VDEVMTRWTLDPGEDVVIWKNGLTVVAVIRARGFVRIESCLNADKRCEGVCQN
jgi:hypothetical protein